MMNQVTTLGNTHGAEEARACVNKAQQMIDAIFRVDVHRFDWHEPVRANHESLVVDLDTEEGDFLQVPIDTIRMYHPRARIHLFEAFDLNDVVRVVGRAGSRLAYGVREGAAHVLNGLLYVDAYLERVLVSWGESIAAHAAHVRTRLTQTPHAPAGTVQEQHVPLVVAPPANLPCMPQPEIVVVSAPETVSVVDPVTPGLAVLVIKRVFHVLRYGHVDTN